MILFFIRAKYMSVKATLNLLCRRQCVRSLPVKAMRVATQGAIKSEFLVVWRSVMCRCQTEHAIARMPSARTAQGLRLAELVICIALRSVGFSAGLRDSTFGDASHCSHAETRARTSLNVTKI
jgi:hypothetical protein